MLKRLKLKSLLPSSALRSNSAALRLSKTPPQGGVFVSDASHFPGGGSRLTRATNTRRHHSGQPTQTPHLPVAPVSAAPPGNKRCQCRSLPQPPGHYSGQPTQTPPLPVAPLSAAPPGNKRCQCHSLQGITPGNQPKHRPLPVAPASAAPPGNKRCQCHSLQGITPGNQPQTPALTRSPGKRSATGEQTVPVP